MNVYMCLFLGFSFFLSGCQYMTAYRLDVSVDQWKQFPAQLQSELSDLSDQMLECEQKTSSYDVTSPDQIDVALEGGYCRAFPSKKIRAFLPHNLTVSNLQCRTVLLTVVEGKEYCLLKLCYRDGGLHIDCAATSHLATTVTIPFNSLWHEGFLYNGFHTNGLAALSSARVRIKSRP